MKLTKFVAGSLTVCALTSMYHPLPVHAGPGSGVLFGTDAFGGNLLVVDTATGAGTPVGPIGVFSVPSLATDPVTGIIYAGHGAGSPLLYTVAPSTGAGTFVGDTGLGFAAIGAMDFRVVGLGTKRTLYAAVNIAGNGGSGSDHLATIDTTTGVATVIGPFGTCIGVVLPSTGAGSCTIEGMEAIAFAPDGRLFGAVNLNGTGAPGLYTIDPATGTATFVAPILDLAGAAPGGGSSSLQFACNGTLYGGTTRSGSLSNGGDLGTIDPTTGLYTRIGNAVPSGTALGALAFAQACDLIPAPTLGPSSLLVLAVSLGVLGCFALLRRRVA